MADKIDAFLNNFKLKKRKLSDSDEEIIKEQILNQNDKIYQKTNLTQINNNDYYPDKIDQNDQSKIFLKESENTNSFKIIHEPELKDKESNISAINKIKPKSNPIVIPPPKKIIASKKVEINKSINHADLFNNISDQTDSINDRNIKVNEKNNQSHNNINDILYNI